MSIIEKRIAKHEDAIETAKKSRERANHILDKMADKINYHQNTIENLKKKRAKININAKDTAEKANPLIKLKEQTKDAKQIGNKLVESGAITEAQRQEIEKLPEPEGRTAQRVPREVQ